MDELPIEYYDELPIEYYGRTTHRILWKQNFKKQFVTVWKKGAVKKSRFVLSCED